MEKTIDIILNVNPKYKSKIENYQIQDIFLMMLKVLSESNITPKMISEKYPNLIFYEKSDIKLELKMPSNYLNYLIPPLKILFELALDQLEDPEQVKLNLIQNLKKNFPNGIIGFMRKEGVIIKRD